MNDSLHRPAFVLGITGHLDPAGDLSEIRASLAALFRFLKRGAARSPELFERLPARHHAPGLEQWPGLMNTPVIVLTSLAPGADTLAAEVALQPEFAKLGFRVLAPLPFPERLYVHSSSFVKKRAQRTAAERQAQETFRALLRKLEPDARFPVWLAGETALPAGERLRRAAADCRSPEASRRRRRYQASPGEPLLRDLLIRDAPGLVAGLRPLSAAREFAARLSHATLRRNSQRSLIAIIWLVFIVSVCIDVASHWHPQNEEETPPVPTAVLPSGEGTVTPAGGLTGRWIRIGGGLLALCCAGSSLLYFERHRRYGVEERDQDYRAVAEGLRVQIAWCAAGLSEAASASYLQRQRNELDWIRTVLSSLHLPIERWQTWFDCLDADLRLRLLTRVRERWVTSQAQYFKRESLRNHDALHTWHKLGSCVALGGLVLVAALTALNLLGVVDLEGRVTLPGALQTTVDAGASMGLLVLIGVATQYLACWRKEYEHLRFGSPERARAARATGRRDWQRLVESTFDADPRKDLDAITWRQWRRWLAQTWFPALDHLLSRAITAAHQPAQESPEERRQQMVTAFARHFKVAVVLGAILCAWVLAAAHHLSWLPDAAGLLVIVSGACLVGGALLVAWAERNLLSEHAYQYNAMASFFAAAQARLQACLAKAAAARAGDWDKARAAQAGAGSPMPPPASAEVESAIREAQALIYDVGREALNENAEWLILHRSRPMEPVMP